MTHMDAPGWVRQHLQTVKLLACGIDFDFKDARLGPSPLLALFNLFRKIFLVHFRQSFWLLDSLAKPKRARHIVSGCKAKSEIYSRIKATDGAAQFQALRCNVRWRAVREVKRVTRDITRR